MDIKFNYDNFLIMDWEKFLSISHCFFPVSSCKNRIMLSVLETDTHSVLVTWSRSCTAWKRVSTVNRLRVHPSLASLHPQIALATERRGPIDNTIQRQATLHNRRSCVRYY